MRVNRTALVIGATGGIGGEVARCLHARGWRVRALSRTPDRARSADPALDWVGGDAMERDSVLRAAEGAAVIVHGANPPGYRNWGGLVLPMLDSTIAAATAQGARVLLPGTVYNFAPEAGAALDETAPQQPRTRKGAIRVEMEQRLEAASGRGMTALVVRAGDFFGPRAGSSWLAQGMLPTAGPVRRVFDPAGRGVGHGWAYLPDLAEIMVALLERPEALADFDVFHSQGFWFDDHRLFADAIRRAAGRPEAPIHRFPWPLLRPAGLFSETAREMRELRYLWQRPLRLVDAKLRRTLGALPETPLQQALQRTLQGLGRMP